MACSPYIYDAAALLGQNLQDLQEVIEASERSKLSHNVLYDLREAMVVTEGLLYQHVNALLQETDECREDLYALQSSERSLSSSLDLLRSLEREVRTKESNEMDTEYERDRPQIYYPTRSATGSLLFRLVVALQLCAVRMDDARLVIAGSRKDRTSSQLGFLSSFVSQAPFVTGITCALAYVTSRQKCFLRNSKSERLLPSLVVAAEIGAVLVIARFLRQSWGAIWMNTKVSRTIEELEEWNSQWHIVQSTTSDDSLHSGEDDSLDAARSRRLIEYALHETPKVSLWQSQGELRFLILKRAMDIFYASVGTALQVTQSPMETDPASWQMTVTAATVASFYTITGARQRAEEATSSSDSARRLIRHAWGMVSLPALKNISLQASRLLKGAAVADRMEIGGVPCFVLSVQPAPELAAATKRFRRKHGNKNTVHTLSTINEDEEQHAPESPFLPKPFARSSAQYRQRDVILHLTGGGFFAHTIASDLPFLMDWSASTGAVVICPEYCLLPKHAFPDALLQVEDVYKTLKSDEGAHVLGFEPARVVLTGESSGGNLGAALCVKLCMDRDKTPTCLELQEPASSSPFGSEDGANVSSDLPCALALSCPVLNLSLELCHSRVVGNQDPVLPSGLLSAISDAYVRDGHGFSKQDPLVSPFFATDAVLSKFPPTLVFASSNGPLLDDSVVLNQRLRSLGVESDLRAAHNLPHAYLGLGTAGFPEAQEVQQQLTEWLNFQLTRDLELTEVDSNS